MFNRRPSWDGIAKAGSSIGYGVHDTAEEGVVASILCVGAVFNHRVQSLGMKQIRTPVKAPKVNAIAVRWVRTVRSECLDHLFIFRHQSLQQFLNEYVFPDELDE